MLDTFTLLSAADYNVHPFLLVKSDILALSGLTNALLYSIFNIKYSTVTEMSYFLFFSSSKRKVIKNDYSQTLLVRTKI